MDRDLHIYRLGRRVFDLRVEARKLAKALGLPRVPRMKLRRRHKRSSRYDGASGHAKTYEIVLSLHRDTDAAEAITLVAHELAHYAGERGDWHNDRFRSRYVDAIRQVYGVTPRVTRRHIYYLDVAIEKALRKALTPQRAAASPRPPRRRRRPAPRRRPRWPGEPDPNVGFPRRLR